MVARKVAVVIHEGVQALDVAGPLDVFNEANSYVADPYETLLIASSYAPVRASNGVQMVADLDYDAAIGKFDILLVAGGPALPHLEPDTALVNWVCQASQRATLYGSICTGAFVLGYAGLLDGYRVTTHWQHAATLASRFPRANVEPDAIHVQDRRLVTSAGVTAGIDLSLALVGQAHGAEVAVAVAKRLVVVAQRQGGQSQFSPFLTAPTDDSSPVARLQAYVMTHLAERHTLQALAGEVGMSTRSLTRHFLREAGVTPHEFIQRVRIDAARRLLEGSEQPLKTIAYECGFSSSDRMRMVFTERLGVTPAQYRASFRRAGAASDSGSNS
ncbi:MAG: GlxA family transcriptional regulator [Porticoccaceae bacterium]|nr:GlxA family transcriptional regulator [Porticoccaceae bacterium]